MLLPCFAGKGVSGKTSGQKSAAGKGASGEKEAPVEDNRPWILKNWMIALPIAFVVSFLPLTVGKRWYSKIPHTPLLFRMIQFCQCSSL